MLSLMRSRDARLPWFQMFLIARMPGVAVLLHAHMSEQECRTEWATCRFAPRPRGLMHTCTYTPRQVATLGRAEAYAHKRKVVRVGSKQLQFPV